MDSHIPLTLVQIRRFLSDKFCFACYDKAISQERLYYLVQEIMGGNWLPVTLLLPTDRGGHPLLPHTLAAFTTAWELDHTFGFADPAELEARYFFQASSTTDPELLSLIKLLEKKLWIGRLGTVVEA